LDHRERRELRASGVVVGELVVPRAAHGVVNVL
jgi:hypothetical protein